MTSLSDRLSVVRPQWEAQLDAFHTLTTRALDSAEQLIALNLKTSRASMEHASGTLHQMLHVRDPRDLFAIGTQAQGQWQQVFSYSRELLGIAMGARQRGWSSLPASTQPAPLLPAPLLSAPASHFAEQAGIAIAEATTVTSEIVAAAVDSNTALAEATLHAAEQSAGKAAGDAIAAAKAAAQPAVPDEVPSELDAEKTGEAPSEIPDSESAVKPADKPADKPATKDAAPVSSIVLPEDETSANLDALVDIVIADDVPPAKAKPLVEALNEIAAKPAGAEHPIASTLPLAAEGHVELPLVTPADSAPPVQLSNGPAPTERRRSSRKKS